MVVVEVMEALKFLFRNILLCGSILLPVSCFSTNMESGINLIGSTPGDEEVKSILALPAERNIDFIRWNVTLDNNRNFLLDIHYGESQPNTLGFKGNGEKMTFKGKYSVSESSDFAEVFHLKCAGLPSEISIAKLSENLYHLLTPQGRLMIGNGGWSYTLNREDPVRQTEISIASRSTASGNPVQLAYEGRTPCQEIAGEHPEMKATASCFKIKWRLVLHRDSITYQPTTCTIRNIVDNQPRDVPGTWEVIHGTATNPHAILYSIQADNLTGPMLFFAGDENILFFLDRNFEPLIGNADFSFTMNRIQSDN